MEYGFDDDRGGFRLLSAEANAVIARGRAAGVERAPLSAAQVGDGSVGDHEVRFGDHARSASCRRPPRTGILLVRLDTGESWVVVPSGSGGLVRRGPEAEPEPEQQPEPEPASGVFSSWEIEDRAQPGGWRALSSSEGAALDEARRGGEFMVSLPTPRSSVRVDVDLSSTPAKLKRVQTTYFHIDSRRLESAYTDEVNELIERAVQSDQDVLTLPDVTAPAGRFEIRFGEATRSEAMPRGSPTGMLQVSLDGRDTRLVLRKERVVSKAAVRERGLPNGEETTATRSAGQLGNPPDGLGPLPGEAPKTVEKAAAQFEKEQRDLDNIWTRSCDAAAAKVVITDADLADKRIFASEPEVQEAMTAEHLGYCQNGDSSFQLLGPGGFFRGKQSRTWAVGQPNDTVIKVVDQETFKLYVARPAVAATRIQSRFRGNQARKTAAQLRAQKTEMVVSGREFLKGPITDEEFQLDDEWWSTQGTSKVDSAGVEHHNADVRAPLALALTSEATHPSAGS